MASITVTIPDSLVQRVRAAYSAKLNKAATVAEVKADLVNVLRSVVRDYEMRIAEGAFVATTRAGIEADLSGVD